MSSDENIAGEGRANKLQKYRRSTLHGAMREAPVYTQWSGFTEEATSGCIDTVLRVFIHK